MIFLILYKMKDVDFWIEHMSQDARITYFNSMIILMEGRSHNCEKYGRGRMGLENKIELSNYLWALLNTKSEIKLKSAAHIIDTLENTYSQKIEFSFIKITDFSSRFQLLQSFV